MADSKAACLAVHSVVVKVAEWAAKLVDQMAAPMVVTRVALSVALKVGLMALQMAEMSAAQSVDELAGPMEGYWAAMMVA